MPSPPAWSTAEAWQPSHLPGGSPGKDDFGDLPAPGSIVIHEVLAHSHGDAPDWIELYNSTTSPINLGGWFLSNSAKDLTRYQIPSGTVILAKGYVVFYENSSFGNSSAPGTRESFSLSEEGESVYLSSGHSGQLTGYSHYVTFGASETFISFGLYTTSVGASEFVSLSEPTPKAANAYPKIGPVVINEIMYNPAADNDAEYVELLNIGTAAVKLYEAETRLGWRFTDDPDNPGITLTFSGSADITIGAGKYVLLVRDKTVFNAVYGSQVPAGTQIFQWTGGRLDNAGDHLDLAKAINIDDVTTGWVHVDRVHYSDGSHPAGADPWPTGADGGGKSLARVKSTQYGNDVANWKAAQASPGQVNP